MNATVNRMIVQLDVPNRGQHGIVGLVESLEGSFTTDMRFAGGRCEILIDADCFKALELALPHYGARLVSTQTLQ